MVKKLKQMAEKQATSSGRLLDSALGAQVKESAQQIWLAGMGAFSRAQAEGTKVFEALVKEGATLQKKTQGMAEEKLSGVSKPDLDLAKSVKERYEKDLFTLPGVIGVGVGKTEDKADATTPAIIVYVNSRPGMLMRGIPSEKDGVKVRVIPSEPFVAY